MIFPFLLLTLKQMFYHYRKWFVQGHSIVQHLWAGSPSQAEMAHIITIEAGSFYASLMQLVSPASLWLVTDEHNYSSSTVSDLHLKAITWCCITTKHQMVSCLLQYMQVNNYCLIRVKSSHQKHNLNTKMCAQDLCKKQSPFTALAVKCLRSCSDYAIIAQTRFPGLHPLLYSWAPLILSHPFDKWNITSSAARVSPELLGKSFLFCENIW